MKKLYVLLFILSSYLSFAQLSIQNDAFVYVNDTYIFVNDDVNIDDVDSKLYLRNEGQLLQGDGITGNSGNGQLSVYQDGTVNKWTYNYWCSPVGASSGNGNSDFNITQLKDAVSNLISNDFSFVTSDDGNNLTSPVEISSRWIYTYQQSADYGDWNYVGTINDIIPGLGFTMKGTSGNPVTGQIVDFRGKPNNGLIINGVRDTEFTLIGNPYPSAMDAVAFIHNPINATVINGVLYYWEQRTDIESHILSNYIGGYAEYTIDITGTVENFVPAVFFTYDANGNALPLPPPGEFGNKIARRFIPIGQGFMVEGSSPFGFVRTTNDMRTFEKESNGNSYFFRDQNNPSQINEGIMYNEYGLNIIPEDYKRFRLNIDFSVSGNDYTRQLLMNFHDTATSGFDYGLEAKRSENLASDGYWFQNDQPYSIQALSFNEDMAIPIVVEINQSQILQFRIFDIQNFEQTQAIYLHDTFNDSYTDLTQTNYSTLIGEGIYTNRFEILFKNNQVLSLDDNPLKSISIHQNNIQSLLEIINPKLHNIKLMNIYDISGKKLIEHLYNTEHNRYTISTAGLSTGVYLVKISTTNNGVLTRKIIISN